MKQRSEIPGRHLLSLYSETLAMHIAFVMSSPNHAHVYMHDLYMHIYIYKSTSLRNQSRLQMPMLLNLSVLTAQLRRFYVDELYKVNYRMKRSLMERVQSF